VEVLEALGNLRMRDAQDGLPKRHQPLTLLWAIGKARQGENRLTPWPAARAQIEDLISSTSRLGAIRLRRKNNGILRACEAPATTTTAGGCPLRDLDTWDGAVVIHSCVGR
jgi:hypothetical protein